MKSNPLGLSNGPLKPANVAQRWWKKRKAGEDHELRITLALEHGGWHAETETDRILTRFVLAERCGLIVEIDKTGRAKDAKWVLTTGEVLYDEYPIEEIPFKDVEIRRLKQSTDLNLSSAKRVGSAAGAAGAAWWAAAEHLPAIGEVVLVLSVGAVFLAEERVRVGMKWGDNNYAVGSMIAYGMSVVDAIKSDQPIFPEGD